MNINDVINRASQLMNDPGFNRVVENSAAAYSGRRSSGGGGGSDPSLSSLERQAFGYSSSDASEDDMYNDFKVDRKKLNEIRDSMNSTPTYSQTYQQQSLYQPNQASGIDYSIIKAIVNQCIKENMQQTINENVGTIRGMKMCGGNKIQFMDSKGNLYEGVLTLKKKSTK